MFEDKEGFARDNKKSKATGTSAKRTHGSTSPRHSSSTALSAIVDDQVDQDSSNGSLLNVGNHESAKMKKFSNPFVLKDKACSHISTSASEDSSSCERSSPSMNNKQFRSGSFEEHYVAPPKGYAKAAPRTLFERQPKSPVELLQCMMTAAFISEAQYAAPLVCAPEP